MTWGKFPDELSKFADCLSADDDTALTADYIQKLYPKFRNSWKTEFSISSEGPGMPIPAPRDKNILPGGCDLGEAFLAFQFSFDESYEALSICTHFQVKVTGLLDHDDSVLELEDHWRVDNANADERDKSNEVHPLIHFQRGGHSQVDFCKQPFFVPGAKLPKNEGDYWRALLQSPGPRIPCPPMCPILAIDFVIGQHDGILWRRLRQSPEYSAIIRESQERLWDPYFTELADASTRRKWIGPWLL